MVTELNGVQTEYEQGLRTIGRHLDSEMAYHASVLEVEGGFTVRYQQSPQQREGRTVHFPWDRLMDLLVFNSAGRGVPGKRKRTLGPLADLAGGREDFFRAVGARLDAEDANSIGVEELPDGVALSYMRPDPENTLRSSKQHMVLHLEEIRGILAEAQARRQAAEQKTSHS